MQIVDLEVSEEDAPELAKKVVSKLFEQGLIAGELSNERVLGNDGYAPGPNLPNICEDEGQFWTLTTSGVSIKVGRSLNYWALAEALEYAQCPLCKIKHDHDRIWETNIGDALDAWYSQQLEISLSCHNCDQASLFKNWVFSPPLGFGNLSFTFWNWPPFDDPCWKMDIPQIVKDALRHEIEISWGRL